MQRALAFACPVSLFNSSFLSPPSSPRHSSSLLPTGIPFIILQPGIYLADSILIAEYLYRQAIPICGNSPLETFSHGHGFRRPPFHNIISFHSWLSYPKIFLGQIEYPPIAKSENEGISLMMNGPPLPFLAYHESTWAKPRWTFIHSFTRFLPCGAISSNLFLKIFSCICRTRSALRGFIVLYSGGTVKVNNGANLQGAAVENAKCKPIVFSGKTRGAFIKFLRCQSRGDWEKE